ncbi:MAG: mannose-1-phosphate guanylyltransferase [Hyphomonadaceae bacterium]
MSIRIIPAIMSGGAGTRLWPVSTEAKPKQFHALGGADSMFIETVRRVSGNVAGLSFAPPTILCNVAHADLVEAQLAAMGVAASAIVLEPEPRNTAAVGAIAAAVAAEIDPDALVMLLPADHLVGDVAAFHAAIARAAPFARERIVTFGIAADRPATGYGYIKQGEELAPGVFTIGHFKEKPELEKAQSYLSEGGYSWNAGMFLFHPAVMLTEFAANTDIRDDALASLVNAKRSGARIALEPALFAQVRAEPLDIAVMQETKQGAVAPCEMSWADVGSWDEIWRLSPQDGAGNVVQGSAVAVDASNNLLRADGVKICVAGVHDLVVVATPEAVIILPRDRAQDVKKLRELGVKLP